MNRLKLNSLSRMGIPSRAIIFSAIVVAVSAFINVLPGVSDAFALITASSSGCLHCYLHFDYALPILSTVNRKNYTPDGFVMPAIKC